MQIEIYKQWLSCFVCSPVVLSMQTHLGLGHVQQTHGVTVTVEERSDCVQGLVKLPLDVCHLFKHLAGRPQQHLCKNVESISKLIYDVA